MTKRALLLINLGTPSAPTRSSVCRYLSEFLSDSRVVRLPTLLRYALLYGFILPFRSAKTTHAYQQIWTNDGSPLRIHGLALENALQIQLKDQCKVKLAMRYGEPSLKTALQDLQDCSEITVLPLFPQYANASTGSALAMVLQHFSQTAQIPSLHIIASFYQHPAYLEAQAALIQPYLSDHDFVLFSYHGLPLKASTPYAKHCYATSTHLAERLKLQSHQYDSSFQSRVGFAPWIQPYTQDRLVQLSKQGIKRLLLVCPSFTADCLETLEEIGQRARDQWLQLGGESFTLVPSLNAHPAWVQSLIRIAEL